MILFENVVATTTFLHAIGFCLKYFNDGDYKARIDNLEGIVVIDFGIDDFNAYAIKPN